MSDWAYTDINNNFKLSKKIAKKGSFAYYYDMMRFGLMLSLLALLACSNKEENLTSPPPPPPPQNNGITQNFDIALAPGGCPNSPCLNSTTADTYCVSQGYEYSTAMTCYQRIQNYQTQLYCRVTCFKQ